VPKRDLSAIARGSSADLQPIQRGRGLTGLLSARLGVALENARLLPLDLIDPNPYQSRQAFDPHALQELADSIREHGVIEPIVVRPGPNEGRFVIVAGERRFRAAGMAGLQDIPSRIAEMDEVQAAFVTALENLQREDLDIEDEARQFIYLMELSGLSQRGLAEKLGKDHNYISRRVRLLKRTDLLADYRAGKKSLTQVLALVVSDSGADAAGSDQDLQEVPEEVAEEGGEGEEGQGLQRLGQDIELLEREDLPGYIVSHVQGTEYDAALGEGTAAVSRSASQPTRFRWRPAMHFQNWLERTKPTAIPPDERASFKAQIAQIKAKLEEWEHEIEEWEHST
jgi:ParB/RepB/Spo0J family partition protein